MNKMKTSENNSNHIRNIYNHSLFGRIAELMWSKYHIEFQVGTNNISRLINRDEINMKEEVYYSGNYMQFNKNWSHLKTMKEIVKFIKAELSIPMDDLRIEKCLIIGGYGDETN